MPPFVSRMSLLGLLIDGGSSAEMNSESNRVDLKGILVPVPAKKSVLIETVEFARQ